MQGLSAYVRASSIGLTRNLRLVGGRVLIESAILAATLMPFLLAWRMIEGHLARALPVLPPTLQPGGLIMADLLLFVTSARFLGPVLGLFGAAAFLGAGLRWGQRAAEVGTLASAARGDDDPPRGFFESLAAYLDRSVVVGVLEFLGLLTFWGWAAGILGAGISFWQVAGEAGPGWGVFASALLAFGFVLVLGVGVVVHAIFPVALTGSIAAGWRPTVAPARALSLLLRRPLLLLGVGGLILGVRVAVALLVGSVAGFAMMLPPEVLLSGPGQLARLVETGIGIFTGGVITVFSYGLITALVLDDEALLPVPARPVPPPPPPVPAPPVSEEPAAPEVLTAEPVLLAVPVASEPPVDAEAALPAEPIYQARPVEEVPEPPEADEEDSEYEPSTDEPEDQA